MKLFGFAFILWIIVYVYGIYKHGIKDVILQHKVFINCLLLVVTVILFAFGCYTNVIYSSKCKIGERVDVAISDVQKERKSIIEVSNECKKGNRLITVAGYVLIFELGIWCIQNKF